jgi:uncharacterized membrane protein
MNCRGLIHINTHSVCQQVVTEPVYALTVQIPWEFQVQLPLVCDLLHWMMSHPLLCSVYAVFTTTFSHFIVIFTAAFSCSVVLLIRHGKQSSLLQDRTHTVSD